MNDHPQSFCEKDAALISEKDQRIISLTAKLKAAEEEVTRLKSVLSSDEEQMKVLVNRNAALRDAAVIKHQEDEIVVQKMRSEREALKAEVERLTDLVRYQRGPLLETGLITQEEYQALLQVPGAVGRLHGYDHMRDDLARVLAEVDALKFRIAALREGLMWLAERADVEGSIYGKKIRELLK